MDQLTGKERAAYVQTLFARIAGRYDLMNRLMTGGQDLRWKKQVVRRARLEPASCLLDIGTGTGDLARLARKLYPQVRVIAADFTLEMMRVGRKNAPLSFSGADALHLPFGGSSFDAVVSGFLMRNVVDLPKALEEQYRVLKTGGRIVILDTTRPQKSIFSPLVRLHMHLIIPGLGTLLSRFGEAYRYLPETTQGFLPAEELAACMSSVGFRDVRFDRLMFGTVALHWAEK